MLNILMYQLHLQRIILATGALLCVSCGGKKGGPGGGMGYGMKATVTATTVTTASYTVSEKFPATLVANNIVDIRSDVTGFLEAIRVKDGSSVTKGQPLYEIDRSRYSAAYSQVNASLQQAQAELAQRQRDYDRYNSLLEHDAISRQTVEQASTAVQTAKANVAAARANVQRAGTDVNHAILRAPVSGKIGIALLRVGDIVNAGQTQINTIVNENPMFADFDVPQSRLQEFIRVEKGNTAIRFLISFTDGTQYDEPGKIQTINNIVDPQTGTIRVRLQFPNGKGMLKSGMSCVVNMIYATPDTQLAIPAKAMIQNLSETSVYTLSKDNVVQPKSVVPGPIVDTLLLINQGLQAGDRVVVEGVQKIRPGDTVNVANGKQ